MKMDDPGPHFAEVVKLVYLEPIAVSPEEDENYRFRVEVLRRPGPSARYHVRVCQIEVFRLRLAGPGTGVGGATAPRDEGVAVGATSLIWERIKADTAEDALAQVLAEIDNVFGGVLGKPAMELKQSEVVKTVDLEPVSLPEQDEYQRFRVEVLKDSRGHGPYFARVYNLGYFDLQPTFPAEDGRTQPDVSSAATHVVNRSLDWEKTTGDTPEEVLLKVHAEINALLGG